MTNLEQKNRIVRCPDCALIRKLEFCTLGCEIVMRTNARKQENERLVELANTFSQLCHQSIYAIKNPSPTSLPISR